MAPKRILVADDEPSIVRLVTTILLRAGYQVDTATNGREALEKIDLNPYEVVVMDLMMPGMSGFEALGRLQIRELHPRYVIIMSAASQEMIADAISVNVFAALRKPFEIDELIATVRACIAARSEDADPLLGQTKSPARRKGRR